MSYAVLIGDVEPPSAGQPLNAEFPSTIANAPCLTQNPGATSRQGRVVDFNCSGYGRYVTLQLLASDQNDGVLRACQLVALSDGAPVPAQPAAPPPAPTYALDPLPANWDVAHRYVDGMGALHGNALLDLGTAEHVVGATTGLSSAGGAGVAFAGEAPCVRFDFSNSADFSFVTRFTAPTTYIPHSTFVLWDNNGVRMQLSSSDLSANATLGIVWGGRSTALAGTVAHNRGRAGSLGHGGHRAEAGAAAGGASPGVGRL